MSEVPAWFQRAVADGFGALSVLELPGQPYTDDDIKRTRKVWSEVLWRKQVDWVEELDARRVREAFLLLAGNITRWPAPAQLLEHIPRRPEPRKLPAPRVSPADRQRNKRYIHEMLNQIGVRRR